MSLWESSFADDESLYALASSVSRELRAAEETSVSLQIEKEKTRKATQECLRWRRKFEECSKRLRHVRTQRDVERARYLTAVAVAKSERAGRRTDLRNAIDFGAACAERCLRQPRADLPEFTFVARNSVDALPPLVLPSVILPPPSALVEDALERRDAIVAQQVRRRLEAHDHLAVAEMRKTLNRCFTRASRATDTTLSSLERVVSLLETANKNETRQRRRSEKLARDLKTARTQLDKAKNMALAELQPQIEDQLRAALAASDAARHTTSSSSPDNHAALVKALQAELAQTKLFCEMLQKNECACRCGAADRSSS